MTAPDPLDEARHLHPSALPPLPQRKPRPTRAVCPQCRRVVGVYRWGVRDEYMAHTISGVPPVGAPFVPECSYGGYLVEDDEVVR